MITQIKVRVKHVYGVATIYPVCDTAKVFADIAGTKTITRSCLLQIKTLGYEVVVVQNVLDVVALEAVQ